MRKLAIVLLLFVGMDVHATQVGKIDAGTKTGMLIAKIAVPEFQPATTDPKTAELTALFNRVLWDDLEYSGVLTVVNRTLYPVGKFAGPADVKVEQWTTPAVDAQFIAFGNVRIDGARIAIEARLWDLKNAQNRELPPSKRYGSEATEEGARLIAHQFADAIVETIGGGLRGIALTKIAFISERATGVKELYVMDYDGHEQHALTNYKNTVITPAWSPDGEKIAFTSFRRNAPDIEILSRLDRRPYTFERAGGTTTTPAWSPDGSRIAFSTSRDGTDTEIYVADWNGRNMRRLTVSRGVDISPVWNPRTGREIAFVSGRSGTPQIYIMDAEGTNVRRLIEEGGEAANPAWSPDGQSIAFAWRRSRSSNLDIYIHNLATGTNVQLTENSSDNQKPTWSPDGRHLAFESSRGGTHQIYTMLANGEKLRRLTQTGKNTGPAWSGYIDR
jgi:TolB protein